MLSVLKPKIEQTLQPVARLLHGVNPNLITSFGLVVPVLFFVFVQQELYIWALVALVLTATDMLDGLVARAQNKVTPFGGFLDSTIDRFSDFVMIVVFGFVGIVSWPLVLILVLLTYLISYIRSRTELAAKGKLVANVGIMERTERLIMLFLGLTMYAIWPDVAVNGLNIMGITFVALIVLSAVTVAQRVVFAYRHL